MNRTILIVIAMLLSIALLAGILVLVGLSQNPLPSDPPSAQTTPKPNTPQGSETAGGTDPGSESIPTDTDPVGTTGPQTPPAYEIPEAFRDIAVLNGDTVTMTMGGYSVTFSTNYRLTDVGGKPSLIAPDGSSARLETAIPARDIDALDDDTKYMASVISQITTAVPSAKLVSASDMVVTTLYETRVGVFTFTLKLGETEIDYKHVCFSDQTRFHTVLLSLIDGTPYTFDEILDTLVKLEEDPTQTDSPIKPPVTNPPVQTDPPSVETDPPGVILPPDDFDDPFDDPSDEYQIPDIFKPFTVVDGDTVKMAFGGYRVSFPTTYQLLSIGGMPALQAPDGSLATLSATPHSGSVDDLTAADGPARLKAAVAEKGGVNPDIPADAEPLIFPYNGTEFAIYSCTYEKAGIEHELTHVIFYSDGMEYTVSMGQVMGSEYSFMDLLYSVEKI